MDYSYVFGENLVDFSAPVFANDREGLHYCADEVLDFFCVLHLHLCDVVFRFKCDSWFPVAGLSFVKAFFAADCQQRHPVRVVIMF